MRVLVTGATGELGSRVLPLLAADHHEVRLGMFYGPTGGHMDGYLAMARFGLAPFLGDPEGYESRLHIDDAACWR